MLKAKRWCNGVSDKRSARRSDQQQQQVIELEVGYDSEDYKTLFMPSLADKIDLDAFDSDRSLILGFEHQKTVK